MSFFLVLSQVMPLHTISAGGERGRVGICILHPAKSFISFVKRLVCDYYVDVLKNKKIVVINCSRERTLLRIYFIVQCFVGKTTLPYHSVVNVLRLSKCAGGSCFVSAVSPCA